MLKDIIGKLFKKKITVYYKKLRPEAKAPYKKHEDDSCWDLYAVKCDHWFGTKDKDVGAASVRVFNGNEGVAVVGGIGVVDAAFGCEV